MMRDSSNVGPYSRFLQRGIVDGRSREGRYLRSFRAELVEHLGGKLSASQTILVERVCFLRLRAALFDEQLIEGKPLGELDYRVYMAISNALVRATRELGPGSATVAKGLTLDEHIAAMPRQGSGRGAAA